MATAKQLENNIKKKKVKVSRLEKELKAESAALAKFEKELEAVKKNRITSYNVCYTKLLRSGTIVADSTQIHQVVMNLCTNAYYAMKDSA